MYLIQPVLSLQAIPCVKDNADVQIELFKVAQVVRLEAEIRTHRLLGDSRDPTSTREKEGWTTYKVTFIIG